MVLLGWAKAFGQNYHAKHLEALRKMIMPSKMANFIAALYKSPKCYVKAEG